MVRPGLRLNPPATSRSADRRSLPLIYPVLKVWGLGACLQWNLYLAYPASLQALHSDNSGIKEIEHNRIKNRNWQEGTSSLFTSVAEDLNSGRPRTNPASGQSGTLEKGMRVRRADHSATLPRPFASSSFVSCDNLPTKFAA